MEVGAEGHCVSRYGLINPKYNAIIMIRACSLEIAQGGERADNLRQIMLHLERKVVKLRASSYASA